MAAGCWLVCSDTSACVEAGNNDCNNKTTSIMVGRSDDRSLEQKKASSKTFLTTARSAQVAATSGSTVSMNLLSTLDHIN